MTDALADYAVMVICAADADQIWHLATKNGGQAQANPYLPALADIGRFNIGYIHDGNFEVLGQLRCNDCYISKCNNVYYGLVLVAKAAVGPMKPGDILVSVRGTMNDLEWVNDATALKLRIGEAGAKGEVGLGFWNIYESMTFAAINTPQGAAEVAGVAAQLFEIAKGLPTARVFVCGHSLGAALATYLSYDLNRVMGDQANRLFPYFFASPRTGTSDWVNWCLKRMLRYDLANYALDFVPMVPPDGDTLPSGGALHNVHIIPALAPGALDAGLLAKFDLVKNHSPVGYALMLDQQNAEARRLNS